MGAEVLSQIEGILAFLEYLLLSVPAIIASKYRR